MTRSAFYTSRFASQAGQGLFFAVLVLVGGGGSTAALGLSSVLVAMVLGALLVGAPAGAIVDRLGAPVALFAGALLRAAAIVTALLVIDRPEYVAAVAFLYSAASQLFSPAELALVRRLRPDGAGQAHATLMGLQYGGQALGAVAVAPILYSIGGLPLMIGGAAAAYAVVAAMAIVLMAHVAGATAGMSHRAAFAWGEVVHYFRREQHAAYAAGLLSFAEIATKCLAVALPFYLMHDLELARTQVAVVAILGAVGAAIGLVWTGRALTPRIAPRAMRLTLIVTVTSVTALVGLGSALMAIAQHSRIGLLAEGAAVVDPGFLVAMPVALLLGLCFSISRVGARTVLSETAPLATQGKVFAAQSVVTDVSVIAPLMLVGAVTGFAGARAALLLVAAIGLVAFLLLEWAARGRGAVDEGVPELTPGAVRVRS